MGRADRTFTGRVVFVLLACAMGMASPSRAQENREPARSAADATSSSDAARRLELERWIRDYTKYQSWRHQWLNRGGSSRDRKPKPQPPVWLFDECTVSTFDLGSMLREACDLLVDWNDDDVTADLRYQIAVARAQGEKPTKTVWWERVHFDGFWPVMNSESSVLGLVGAHVTVAIEGRLQVFATPGVILLSIPTADGRRELKAATDWGFAYRLFDFKFPLSDRPASFHVNFARAWLLGNAGGLPVESHVDLAGFSVTFRKPPK